MSDISKKRVAALISGRGSNMASLVTAARAPDFPATIELVVSNRPGALGLTTAAENGIATDVIDHKDFASREAFEARLQAALEARAIDIVCLAGFMRILTADFVTLWTDRMINIHPALLPSYKGLHTHERALADGVRIHGCTVHFVVPEMDAGPIIAQAAVEVRDDDTPETLGARVLAREHAIYPEALRLIATGAYKIENGRVRGGLARGLAGDRPPKR